MSDDGSKTRRRCEHGVECGPLDDYGIPSDQPVESSACRVCNPDGGFVWPKGAAIAELFDDDRERPTRAQFIKHLVAEFGLPDPAPLKAASSDTMPLPHLVAAAVLYAGLEPSEVRAYDVDLAEREIRVVMNAPPEMIEMSIPPVKDLGR